LKYVWPKQRPTLTSGKVSIDGKSIESKSLANRCPWIVITAFTRDDGYTREENPTLSDGDISK